MKKVFVLATAAFMFTGVAFADHGDKGKKKKCSKGKSCCSKGTSTTSVPAGNANKTVKL